MTKYAAIKDRLIDCLAENIWATKTENQMDITGSTLCRELLYSFHLILDGNPVWRNPFYEDRLGCPPLDGPHTNWTGLTYQTCYDPEKL